MKHPLKDANQANHASYDRLPTIHVSDDTSACHSGWDEIIAEVRRSAYGRERSVLVVECYPGTDAAEIRAELQDLDAATIFFAEDALKSPETIEALLKPWLGDDLVFSRMRSWEVSLFFEPEKVERMRNEIARAPSLVIVYGTGAAYVAQQWDRLLYCDITRWEVQQRRRAHRISNLGANNRAASPMALYKRGYFVDWRVGDVEKHRLHRELDYYIDTHVPALPNMISGDHYRQSLAKTARRPFRLVPFFDPGIWGVNGCERILTCRRRRRITPGVLIACPRRIASASASEIASSKLPLFRWFMSSQSSCLALRLWRASERNFLYVSTC